MDNNQRLEGSNQDGELLQCFDEQGNLAGSKTRGEVHMEPLRYWHGVTNIWIVNKDGKILCSRRGVNASKNAGKWQTYFGGHVRAGDSFQKNRDTGARRGNWIGR